MTSDTGRKFESCRSSSTAKTLRSALSTALEGVQDDLSLGLDLYPFPEGCEVPSDADVPVGVEAGAEALPKILDALESTEPSGGTPTALADARQSITARNQRCRITAERPEVVVALRREGMHSTTK